MNADAPQPKRSKKPLAKAIYVVAVGFTLYHILYITGTLSRLGIYFEIPVHLAWHLGVMLAFTFVLVPAGKGKARKKVPWYEWALLAVGLGWNLYIIFNFNDLYIRNNMGQALTIPELVTAWVFFFVILEAARRLLGTTVAVLGALFLVYPLVAAWLPGVLTGPTFTFDRVGRAIGLFTTGMYGDILNVSATVVISFMIFGQFLQMSGAGAWFIDVARSLLGHVRGGPAKVAILASSLMGTVQGSATASVATVGVITIPLMIKTGYRPHIAGGIEAAAANGAQIMPPVMGIAAFIMVDFLGVGYNRIVLAGILPAVVYYAALFFSIDFEAAKAGLAGVPRSELPPLGRTLVGGWYFMLPIIVLLVFLLYFQFSAQLSALYATATIVIVSSFRKTNRITLRRFFDCLKSTATTMMMIAVTCALAGIIVGSVQLTGLSFRLSYLLTYFAGDSLISLLVLTAVVSIILGMGMPTSAVYILLATLVAPTLVKMGIVPIAAHFFVFYFGVVALITPPVAPAAFVAAAIAKSDPMRTGWSAMRLGIAAFLVPFVFVYKPEMLLQGNILSGLIVGIEAAITVFAIAAGLGGYLLKPLNPLFRVVILAAGLIMLYPPVWATLTGAAIVITAAVYQTLTIVSLKTGALSATKNMEGGSNG